MPAFFASDTSPGDVVNQKAWSVSFKGVLLTRACLLMKHSELCLVRSEVLVTGDDIRLEAGRVCKLHLRDGPLVLHSAFHLVASPFNSGRHKYATVSPVSRRRLLERLRHVVSQARYSQQARLLKQ
jgi:hypothetical protein